MILITMFLNHVDTILKLAQILSYVLTPLIAIFVARITLGIQKRQIEMQKQQVEIQAQQTLTNQSQHRFAFMEKRMEVYRAVNNFISFLLTDRFKPDKPPKEIYALVDDTSLGGVLFGEEVQNYIEILHSKAIRIYLFHTDKVPGQAMKHEYIQENQDIMVWISHQPSEVRKLFLPYLDFRTP
jgi:hypothetical protein